MSALNVQNLTFGYGGDLVFDNACFRLDTDWKTGLIGRNGKGKTTFMKLLCGRIEYCGRIESSVKFTYFPFPVPDTGRLCIEIINEICHAAEDWQIIRELSLLQTDAEARSFLPRDAFRLSTSLPTTSTRRGAGSFPTT